MDNVHSLFYKKWDLMVHGSGNGDDKKSDGRK